MQLSYLLLIIFFFDELIACESLVLIWATTPAQRCSDNMCYDLNSYTNCLMTTDDELKANIPCSFFFNFLAIKKKNMRCYLKRKNWTWNNKNAAQF